MRNLIADRLPPLYSAMQGDGIDESYERGWGWSADRKSEDGERREAARQWSEALSEKGWVAPHWPARYGGAGLTPNEQLIYSQEMVLAGAPQVGGSGVRLLGPTLIVHGTEAQRSRYLPAILSGTTVWAQGYSEPSAGSDLASLQTSAVRAGDDYIINGQKTWTSNAHHADAIFVLARTDPDAPKHRGISFLLVDDIETPGLSVRPLINMAWEHEFNETFFEDVRTPVANAVGEENRGWYVGATLLDFERSNISRAVLLRRLVHALIDCFSRNTCSHPLRISNATRHDVAERYLEAEVAKNFSLRIVTMQAAGQMPNYEASVAKMFVSESSQRVARTGMRVFGLYSNIWDTEDTRAPMKAVFAHRYVTTTSATVGAGTSEIQRNIIATRGLGLPRA